MAAPMQGDIPLLLEIWINGRDKNIVVQAVQRENMLMVDALTLQDAGLKFDLDEVRSDGFIAADALPDVKMTLVNSDQKLDISAPPERLEAQVFDLKPSPGPHTASSGKGFIGQYDIVGTVDNFSEMNQSSTVGATLGGTYFTPQGNFTATGFTESQSGKTDAVRLDTNYEKDDPDTLKRWVAGDAISGSQSWSRSVRFGGFQMATDFSLRPDLSTLPLPAFFGQTAVPASVDVFVNSARVYETNVEPGPFQINNLPVITGNGDASIIVRNALGQESVVTLPFYASNALLRQGLSSYDVDAGFLRDNYGLQSFDYDVPVAAGTYSVGQTNWLTLEAHSEAAQRVQLAGAGASIGLAPYGVVHFASAFSNNDLGNSPDRGHLGALNSVSFETESRPVGFFGSVNATEGNYADIASIGATRPPDLQTQIGANVGLGNYGSAAISFIGMERAGQETTRLTTASYTLSLGPRWNVGVTGFYDESHEETVIQGFLSVSLGGGWIGNSNISGGNRIHQEQASMTKPANPDGGVGYRLSDTQGDTTIREGGATWIGSHGSLDADLESQNGDQAGRLTASGGVVVMDGGVYMTKHPDGSVALVETGEPGTDIYRENRQVATADEDGKALLTGLVPFTDNHVSIDPSHYKFSTVVDVMDKTVTPGRQNGVIVDFTPQPHSPAVIILQMQDGSFPPLGSRVSVDGSDEPLVIGHHGEMFISDLHAPTYGTVNYGAGTCQFAVDSPAAASNEDIPRVGPLLCQLEPIIP